MATIVLVSGGARSGKSSFAQSLCESLSQSTQAVYLATAPRHLWDADLEERIQHHEQSRASDQWITVEEPLYLSRHVPDKFRTKCVLIDCLTLWLTNVMAEKGAFETPKKEDNKEVQVASENDIKQAAEQSLTFCKQEFNELTKAWNVTYVIVTNELGCGTHGNGALARKFVDVQGWLNQYVAQHATVVVHMVCGQPHILKNEASLPSSPSLQSLTSVLLDLHLSKRTLTMDSKAYFIIKTLDKEKKIKISIHSCMKNERDELCDLEGNRLSCHGASPAPLHTWICSTAKEATYQIFEEWQPATVARLELSLGHAAYVGREVQKAEYCLQHGLSYQQD